jgi:glycosyltransferase involved in cell wall biosynthesis
MNGKKIKILQITHDLAIGGLQRVVVTLCKYYNRDLFEFSVLCLRDKGSYLSDVESLGIPVYFLADHPGEIDHFLFLKVRKFLKEHQFDVIHTHNTQPFLDGGLGKILSGARCKWIHTDHARRYPDKTKYIAFEWIVSHFADKIVGVSHHTSNNLLRYGHLSKKKITTIHNGIVPDEFLKTIDCTGLKKSIGLPDKGKIIGTAVRLSEQKNVGLLINAFKNVSETVKDVSLVIAGNGPLESTLKQHVDRLGLKNIFFLGPRNDIAALLQLFDIYVLPSIWEGLPMGILEAMASKCVVVATNVGGVGELIQNGVNGVLIESGDVQALTIALRNLLLNNELTYKYRDNAFNDFIQKYTAEKMTVKYEELYN